MNAVVLSGFLDEFQKIASGGESPTKIPVTKAEKWKAFRHGVRGEIGPAAGATVGAGLASMFGVNPLAGAAAGYGAGALPDIIMGLKERAKLGKLLKLRKLAGFNPSAMKGFADAIARSSGAMGRAAVPRAKPMTLIIGKGGLKRVPLHAGPPPIPMGA